MKRMLPWLAIMLAAGLIVVGAQAQDNTTRGNMVSQSDLAKVKNPLNPKPFQNNLAPPSGFIQFLLTEKGKGMVSRTNHPNLRGLMMRLGADIGSAPLATASRAAARRQNQDSENNGCNNQLGTRFNNEPGTGMAEIGFPVPKNETPVDFIPGAGVDGSDLILGGANDYRGPLDASSAGLRPPLPNAWGFSITGYYVRLGGPSCRATFEGGLPHISAPTTGETLYGGGDPVPALDASRGNAYFTDLRFGFTATGIGLFKSNTANFRNPAVCPLGTHVTDASGNDTTASRCWPVGVLLNANTNFLQTSDKPHMRPDERRSGTGAGDIYVTWTFFDFSAGTSVIQLAVCPASFAAATDCSTPMTISGSDGSTQFSHIVVRPDGVVSITYVNANSVFNPNAVPFLVVSNEIKYITCKPQGAPTAPNCSAPALVTTEAQPVLGAFATNDFRVSTYPTHDVRQRHGQLEEFLAWTRCKNSPFVPIGDGTQSEQIECGDMDVVFTSSLTDGSGNPAGWAPIQGVNTNGGDQFFSWVKTNYGTNVVNIAYYSSENDPFKHRLQVFLNEIGPGENEVGGPIVMTQTQNDPGPDPILGNTFFGDYIGLASRGGSTYVHTTANLLGSFGGALVPGQENVLTHISAGVK